MRPGMITLGWISGACADRQGTATMTISKTSGRLALVLAASATLAALGGALGPPAYGRSATQVAPARQDQTAVMALPARCLGDSRCGEKPSPFQQITDIIGVEAPIMQKS